jgi:hypothetical protein
MQKHSKTQLNIKILQQETHLVVNVVKNMKNNVIANGLKHHQVTTNAINKHQNVLFVL